MITNSRGSSLPKEDSEKGADLKAAFERSVILRRSALRKGEVCMCPSHMRYSGRLFGISKRVHIAFHKAFQVRTRFIGRPLTHKETYALFDAVKKQSNPRLAPRREEKAVTASRHSEQLKVLAAKVERLESVRPTSLSEVHDKMELVKLQVQLLQRTIFHLTMEMDQVSESCPHYKLKKVTSFDFGQSSISVECEKFTTLLVGSSKQTLCCERCLLAREDFCFEKLGSLPSIKESEDSGANEECLKGVHLLKLSSIWADLLNHIFERSI